MDRRLVSTTNGGLGILIDFSRSGFISLFFKILMQTYTNTNRSIGVRIALGSGHLISFWSVHLDYKSFGPYAANNKMVTSLDQILTGENPKEGAGEDEYVNFEANPQMQHWLSKSEMIPVILAGDFNSPSHIDWTEETIDKHGNWAVEWPATKILDNMGFIDSFRAVHPNISSVPGW
ncbi:hypothetical protein DICVIV_01653 [Dictyocaulus viviparus]|uniref:Endonuclease/exonuclease/phosphatase domain-containing protein n=1 Tax=Dictyocaulus viviparus TaxID=29172 RepID=A0A0D8Y5S7_DICVI|nr:hypothetical protein DICVIV_01653 [Dictyocaulus viviparus]